MVLKKKSYAKHTYAEKACLQYELSHNSESILNEIPVIFLF